MTEKRRAKTVEMYPWSYVFNGKVTVLIWQVTDKNYGDNFKLDSKKNLIESPSVDQMKKRLGKEAEKVIWEDESSINFDKFWVALRNLRVGRGSSIKTCDILLNGWNFIEDMLTTFNYEDEKKKLRVPILQKTYDKVFYGNNLPSVTPEGVSYEPLWLREEIVSMRKAFRSAWSFLVKKGHIVQ